MPQGKNKKSSDRNKPKATGSIKEKKPAAGRSLKTGRERLEHLLALSPAVLYTRTASRDFHATFISSNVIEHLGYESIQFTEDPEFWPRHIHPDDCLEVFSGLSDLFEQGHHVLHYRFLHKDGSYRWIQDELRLMKNEKGNPVEIAGSWSDITTPYLARQELERHRFNLEELVKERTAELEELNKTLEKNIIDKKLTEEALHASEEQFRRTFDLSPVGAVMVGPDFRFTRCNEAFCRFLGYSEEELMGRKFIEVTHPDDRLIARSELNEILAGARESARFQKRYLRKDGTTVWGEITIRGVPDLEGRPLFFLPIIDDITERKRNEELISRTLSEKEVLLKEIHHRIKNNLQMVSSLLALQAAKFDDPLLQEAFRESRSRIKSIALVHEKLYQSLNITQINFRDYLHDLVNDIFLAFGQPGITFTIDCCNFYPSVDKAIPLALIINELVSNALKHAFPMRKEGSIGIELAQGENKRIILKVRDNGTGFPEGIDFENTSSLGLQLVVLFVQQLNGTLELARDNGAVFVVEIE
jgi:PAS domain S-box-containing protein